MTNYETAYYGLLHVLKDLSIFLKRERDFFADTTTIDNFVQFIDHEIARGGSKKKEPIHESH